MEKPDDGGTTVSVHSVDGPWTPNRSRTWGNDAVETERKRRSWAWTWGVRNRWEATRRRFEHALKPAIQSAAQLMQSFFVAVWRFACCSLWPFLIRVFKAKKQWLALVLFLSGGVVPMVVLGYYTPRPFYQQNDSFPYYGVFAAKSMTCGNNIDDQPANSTVEGFEGLFVLDQTWGRFSFATVKTIDVIWDIFFGRGIQMIAWWVGYVVFSDALLRLIERHPASFRIFQRIALEGPSLLSLWTLCKEVLSINSKRSKALFAYILLSTTYILCIPMFLGAMTGYDSTSIAWMDLDDTNNIVPTSALKFSWVIRGTSNSTFDKPVCRNVSDAYLRNEFTFPRLQWCTCQMPNGTFAPPHTFYAFNGKVLLEEDTLQETDVTQCLFNYPGANETWSEQKYDSEHWDAQTRSYRNVTYNCNETVTYKLNDKQYDIQTIVGTNAYCYGDKAYEWSDLIGKSRCLPDTANPTYQWGFSTMLSGVFVFIHFGWCVSMYIVWLNSQATSILIREGFEMTPLRAAFAIAKAVKRRTGLGEKQLVRRDTRELDRDLDGTRGEKGTRIEYEIFAPDPDPEGAEDDERQVRRRRALALDGVPSG
ncbi:hypothetical protein SVAN01_05163 [Stagonosporopsis vannaccii]|nr:hypothetical protein SVAN01_05163 [Stagonosporopsis vannaccii]